HHNMPDAILPIGFSLNASLALLAGQGTEAPPDQVFNGGRSPGDDLKSSGFPTFGLLLSSPCCAPVNVALPISFPMPDIDVMIQLSHAEEGWGIAQWKANRGPVPECSGGQAVVFRVVLPFQEKNDFLTVVNGADREGPGCRFRPDRTSDH